MVTEGKAPETVIPGKDAARLSESAETDYPTFVAEWGDYVSDIQLQSWCDRCRCIRLAGDVCGDRLGRTDGLIAVLSRTLIGDDVMLVGVLLSARRRFCPVA
jgi:hypothetical protein